MFRHHVLILAAMLFVTTGVAPYAQAETPASTSGFTLKQVLGYPFPKHLVAAPRGGAVAWTVNERGIRNVEVATPPDYKPRRVTDYDVDDGQQLTNLQFSPNGKYLVYVRGGEHGADWEVKQAPDPASSPIQPKVTIWVVKLSRGKAKPLVEGDMPAVSARGQVAYLKDHAVWEVPINGDGKPQRLFYDHAEDRDLHWSPDGSRLAFVSDRGDHAFIGVFTSRGQPLVYLAPSTSRDGTPRWSPDGKRVAFTRRPGYGGKPRPLLKRTPRPWAIWVANATTGKGRAVWKSPDTLRGSWPRTTGGPNLNWAAGDRLVFLNDLDGWPHLYSMPAAGGKPLRLTPGKFMVQDVSESPDRKWLVYNANTGTTAHDSERRHLYRVPVDAAKPEALTSGTTIEWSPVITSSGKHVVYIQAGARRPPLLCVADDNGGNARAMDAGTIPADFPTRQLVVPRDVTFKAPDGWTIHGQLFQRGNGDGKAEPGIVFVHGGPSRQMLLGWHPMGYYSNSYAVNQYLANHGFVVLSVNYRSGVGYGFAFHNPADAGTAGASEYQDVLAGARFLQNVTGVDGNRIGIWGGSWGGFLTALALARNSDVFKAGVDTSGIHNWTSDTAGSLASRYQQYQKGDWNEAMRVGWESSPDSSIDKWTSPVLLVQGDDDHEVHFHQMVGLANRLRAHHVPFKELVIPNGMHVFLRYAAWYRIDKATAGFFRDKLDGNGHRGKASDHARDTGSNGSDD